MPTDFERYYYFNQIEEWATAYMDYRKLKKAVKNAKLIKPGDDDMQPPLSEVANGVRRRIVPSDEAGLGYSPLLGGADPYGTGPDSGADGAEGVDFRPRRKSSGGVGARWSGFQVPLLLTPKDRSDSDERMTYDEWGKMYFDMISSEVRRVNEFFIAKRDNIARRIDGVVLSEDRIESLTGEIQEMANRSMHSSMRMVLNDMFQEVRYLSHYSQLNFTCGRKFIKKLDKKVGSNVAEDYSNEMRQMEFMNEETIDKLKSDIVRKYAHLFTDGREPKAQAELGRMERPLSQLSMLRIGIQFGMVLLLIFFVFLAALVAPAKKIGKEDEFDGYLRRRFYVTLPVYRGIGLIIVWMWAWGCLTWIWSKFRISYVYIFEMSPRSELGYVRVFKSASFLTIGWLTSFLFYFTAEHNGYHFVDISASYYPIILVVFFLVMVFSPPGAFHFKSRMYIVRTMMRIAISPFGDSPTFRDNYIADVLTSMTKVLFDIMYTACFFIAGDFNEQGHCLGQGEKKCVCNSVNQFMLPIVSILPFWWRLQQCLRRYYDSREGKHLANAFKYLTGMTVILSAAVGGFDSMHMDITATAATPWRWVWVFCLVFSSLYNAWWDTFMDWGVFELKGCCLVFREKLLFKRKWVYLISVLLNIVARFAWSLSITPRYIDLFNINHQVFICIISLIEVLRRAHWSIYRVEYEHVMNPDKERDITKMPETLFFSNRDPETIYSAGCKTFVILFNFLVTTVVGAVVFYFYHQYMNSDK